MTSPAPFFAELATIANEHPMWSELRTVPAICSFMEHHVWAVWDFMALVKSVQAELAPTGIPWIPPPDPIATRLINEIVLGEESDEDPDGGYASHFEIYLRAMEDAGADQGPIRRFLAALVRGEPVAVALDGAGAPAAACAFVRTTIATCAASLPERIAAFTIGREQIIPSMFTTALATLPDDPRLRRFTWYLRRHVAVDGEHHAPMSARLFAQACSTEPHRERAVGAARLALENRIRLWDAVLDVLAPFRTK